jgi:hypothetical protein
MSPLFSGARKKGTLWSWSTNGSIKTAVVGISVGLPLT